MIRVKSLVILSPVASTSFTSHVMATEEWCVGAISAQHPLFSFPEFCSQENRGRNGMDGWMGGRKYSFGVGGEVKYVDLF